MLNGALAVDGVFLSGKEKSVQVKEPLAQLLTSPSTRDFLDMTVPLAPYCKQSSRFNLKFLLYSCHKVG